MSWEGTVNKYHLRIHLVWTPNAVEFSARCARGWQDKPLPQSMRAVDHGQLTVCDALLAHRED